MLPNDLGQLVGENRYRIDRSRWAMAICAYLSTGLPWAANRIQEKRFGEQSDALSMIADPLFVVGHWRSGTTLLHELLTLDPQFAFPNTFQCFNPLSFLVTEHWLRPLTSPLLPKRRPMDNMAMGWNVPQEDEFALMTMGLPTTYRRIAFPNEVPRHLDYLNMHGIPAPELERWKSGFAKFVGYLNFKYRRQLVLKSPPHTGRISIIKSMYPNAKFIHMTRNPRAFIPSTDHLWRSLEITNGFQKPRYESNAEFVFMCFKRMYDGYFRDQEELTAQNFATLKFENLVSDPVEAMRKLYEGLRLGDFSQTEPKIRSRMEQSKGYRSNKYELPKELQDQIDHYCQRYDDEFGYSSDFVSP